jgi:huntingtin
VARLILFLNSCTNDISLFKKRIFFFQPSFVCRVLRCLEGVHPSQSGALLILLIPRLLGLPHLALARLAGKLACRRAELLLTLPSEEVATQLTEADLRKLMDILHSTSLARK